MLSDNKRFEPTAKILCDSSAYGSRLTTMEIVFHRYVLAEFNTHRMFSRNGASSRAIPVQRMIDKCRTANVEPLEWGRNQSGMQAYEQLTGAELAYAKQAWNVARARAIDVAEALAEANAHKQIVNRILEPFLPMTMVVTGDNRAYANFFSQRAHHAAAPEIRELAYRMLEAHESSVPQELTKGSWHLPFYSRELAELPLYDCVKACVARCARVSYNNHNGERDIKADIGLFEKLVSAKPPHASPLEHVAVVSYFGELPKELGLKLKREPSDRGNFLTPWLQLRKILELTNNG